MVAAGDAGKGGVDVAERLDIEPEMVVQEIGWDEDVDDDVRANIEERIGGDLLDEDADDESDDEDEELPPSLAEPDELLDALLPFDFEDDELSPPELPLRA